MLGHFRRIAVLALLAIGLATPAPAQDLADITDAVEAWLTSPHAERGARAFTHWDEDGAVPEGCAACHSGPGFLDFLGADGTAAGIVDGPAPTGAPIGCVACHNAAAAALETVTFPSGVEATGLGTSAVCTVCHQGRNSTDSVDGAIGGADDDAVSGELAFLNIHYRAAAATLMGGAARGGYQYAGRSYVGQFAHVPDYNTCAACHDPHTTAVETVGCAACHQGVTEPTEIRTQVTDFDGDGDTAEGIHAEIAALHDMLREAIRSYGAEVAGTPIAYAADSYPYFFADTDGDGEAGPAEAIYPNRYQSWTPRLLRAAYNYQFVAKDPGGYAHNPRYILQLLHDSLESLGERVAVDMDGLARP